MKKVIAGIVAGVVVAGVATIAYATNSSYTFVCANSNPVAVYAAGNPTPIFTSCVNGQVQIQAVQAPLASPVQP